MSFLEILIILLVGLVVLGPKELAKILTKVMQLYFLAKSYITNVKNEFYMQSGVHDFGSIKEELEASYEELINQVKSKEHLQKNLDLPIQQSTQTKERHQGELF